MPNTVMRKGKGQGNTIHGLFRDSEKHDPPEVKKHMASLGETYNQTIKYMQECGFTSAELTYAKEVAKQIKRLTARLAFFSKMCGHIEKKISKNIKDEKEDIYDGITPFELDCIGSKAKKEVAEAESKLSTLRKEWSEITRMDRLREARITELESRVEANKNTVGGFVVQWNMPRPPQEINEIEDESSTNS